MVDSATLARLIDHAERGRGEARPGRRPRAARRDRGGRPVPRARRAQRADPPRRGDPPRARARPRGGEADPRGRGRARRSTSTDPRSGSSSPPTPRPAARRWSATGSESFERGEDAVMVAKRNAEVEQLNALAREDARPEAQLGAQEIEVGGGALRRRRSGHHPRQRPQGRHLQPRALAGRRGRRRASAASSSTASTRPQRVEVDADYLARVNPHSTPRRSSTPTP